MASKRESEKSERRPRNVIYDAQEVAHRYYEACAGVHQGVERAVPERVERGFHNAVVSYWLTLYQYREENQVKDEWGNGELKLPDGPIRLGGATIESLDDITEAMFPVAKKQNVETHPTRGSTRSTEIRSAYLDPRDATMIYMALNDIARELGLGIQVRAQVDDDPLPV